jgi:hypothetical protein
VLEDRALFVGDEEAQGHGCNQNCLGVSVASIWPP